MIHFSPGCHSVLGHIFHPKCDSLSHKQKDIYTTISKILEQVTCGYAHQLHEKHWHTKKTESEISESETVLLIPAVNEEQASYDELINSIEETVKREFDLETVNCRMGKGLDELLPIYGKEKNVLQEFLVNLANREFPWGREEIIAQFDKTFRLAFVIGICNLNEVANRWERNEQFAQNFATDIARQGGEINYRAFFYIPSLYELARGCFRYKLSSGDALLLSHLPMFYEQNKLTFYQKGAKPEQWRQLYNAYCEIVYTYSSKELIQKADDRFTIHTKMDLHPCQYKWNIGTVPS